MATPKQEKLIRLIFDNIGTKGLTKTKGELLKEAGYSVAIQKNPNLIFESEVIQDGVKDFVTTLEEKRNLAISKVSEEKLEASSARDLAAITDTLTKNIQLLTGGATERNEPLLVKIIGEDEKSNGDTKD